MITKEQRIQRKLAKMAKELLELCMKLGYDNPLFEMNIEVKDGGSYKLRFERIDLDLTDNN